MDSSMNEYTEGEKNVILSEFSRVKETYLDHAGTTLYSEEQIKNIHENLLSNVYSNPHTNKTTEDLIDQVRFRILEHFNTTTSKYSLTFTSGATSSLKLIGETFSFAPINDDSNKQPGSFIYNQDNHTSVLGMREIVNTKNIIPVRKDVLLNEMNQNQNITLGERNHNIGNSLFVVSAQCNFSGYKFPLEIIDYVQNQGLKSTDNIDKSNWFVCLDAASFVSTNFLDLSKWSPDFVCISFYKMFGYPTGLGGLLVLNKSKYIINKKYYGGGTVKIAMSEKNWHRKREEFHDRLEDGTLPFLSIISLVSGFNTLKRLIPPKSNVNTMCRISKHTFNLANYSYTNLSALKYYNGNPVVKMYNDTNYMSPERQGGIVNFNLLRNDGAYIGFAEIGHMASIYNITLRTGCFCNPGACQRHLNLSNDDLKKQYNAGHICGDSNDLIDGQPTGSIRISFGYMSSTQDVDAIINMIVSSYLKENNFERSLTSIDRNYEIKPPNKLNKLVSDYAVKLKTICIYPIKSCGGYKVDEWSLSSKGLLYDREWMIVNDNGLALTQKTSPEMCLIKPVINLENNTMILSYSNQDSIEIKLSISFSEKELYFATLCHSKVCGDQIEGIDCGDDIANWLSTALNISGLRLIKQIDNFERISKKTNAQLSLANQSQLLLINSTSVMWLAEKVDDWVKHGRFQEINLEGVIDRFRGNLIVESPEPLQEHSWKFVKIGDTLFQAEGPCSRCQMICIDQHTGIKTTEPLKTIAHEFQGKLKFGLYLKQVTDSSSISTKDIISFK